MSTHDEFRDLLNGLDQTAAPDPLFARRLRGRFVAEAQAENGSGSLDTHRGTGPEPIRRNRLLDLAAVAILVLSMIGGMIGVNPGVMSNPTPTVQAATPIPEPALLSSGNAARDGRYPGPEPNADSYDLAWTASVDEILPGSNTLIWHDQLFRYLWLDEEQTELGFGAVELASGTLIWSVPAAINATFAGVETGVLVMVPDQAEPTEQFRLVLLNYRTGSELWRSGADFGIAWSLSVGNETAIVSESNGQVTAIDLVTGATRWGYRTERTVPIGVEPNVCDTFMGPCTDRSSWNLEIVTYNGAIYLIDNMTLSVTAIDEITGAEIWRTRYADLAPQSSESALIVNGSSAIDEGVVFNLQDVSTEGWTDGISLVLLAPDSGEVAWSLDISPASPIVVTNSGNLVLNINSVDPNTHPCCDIVEIDPDTAAMRVIAEPDTGTFVEAYLTDSNEVLYRTVEGPPQLRALNPETGDELWTVPTSNNCSSTKYPLGEDGTMACYSNLGNLSVYRPVLTSATPNPAASPVASPEP